MQRSTIVKCAGAILAAALLFVGSPAAADRRHRPVYVVPGRYYVAPPRGRRYYGPVIGAYGSPVYAITNSRYFPNAPPVMPGYGPAFGGAGYPSVYFGNPYAAYSPPGSDSPDLLSNPLLQGTMLENQLRWGMGLPPAVSSPGVRRRHRPSTPQQQVNSIHEQAQGDVWLRKLQFLNAYEHYKSAIRAAGDRPEPYFRSAYAMAAIGRFDEAVKYIKQGLDLDPQWPAHGERLDTVFGDGNRLTVLSLTERAADWLREDLRDPDRIFLMGVLLHFDGDSRANEFFELAYRLAGYGDHLLAFLQPAGGPPNGQPNGPPPQPYGPPTPSNQPFGPQPFAPQPGQPSAAPPFQSNAPNGPPGSSLVPPAPAPMEPSMPFGPPGAPNLNDGPPPAPNNAGPSTPELTPRSIGPSGPYARPRGDQSAPPFFFDPRANRSRSAPRNTRPQYPRPQYPGPQYPGSQNPGSQPNWTPPAPGPAPSSPAPATPQGPAPAPSARPVPPLPSPPDAGPAENSNPDSTSNSGPPLNGPTLTLPPPAPPVTVQSR